MAEIEITGMVAAFSPEHIQIASDAADAVGGVLVVNVAFKEGELKSFVISVAEDADGESISAAVVDAVTGAISAQGEG